MREPIRVLVVDDSPLVRSLLSAGLGADGDIEVVGTAADPYEARDKIVALKPDVLTLDVEMPRMSGVDFLRKLMPQYPIPVVMVSSLTRSGQQVTLDALAAGAVDFVPKPSGMRGQGVDAMISALRTKVRLAAGARVSAARPPAVVPAERLERSLVDVVAIGASTGGVEALQEVVGGLPVNCPPTVIAQHMLPGFMKTFAERLDERCAVRVAEASDGEPLVRGRVLLAPGDRHLLVERVGRRYVARLSDQPPVNRHRPAVDVLLHSVADQVGERAVGVILTGMGRDGAAGLLAMRRAGAHTLSQDQETSVVYGMPRAVVENGASERALPLGAIAGAIIELASRRSKAA